MLDWLNHGWIHLVQLITIGRGLRAEHSPSCQQVIRLLTFSVRATNNSANLETNLQKTFKEILSIPISFRNMCKDFTGRTLAPTSIVVSRFQISQEGPDSIQEVHLLLIPDQLCCISSALGDSLIQASDKSCRIIAFELLT
ncbi:hypothetical protein J6590_030853 [Homalodisca vitripennis]|nr:hypothetical protein J6590_030853 [Homalodisca vitripennis]